MAPKLCLPSSSDRQELKAQVDLFFIPLSCTVSFAHFLELAEKDAGKERSVAIIDEVSNLFSEFSSFSYYFGVVDPETQYWSLPLMAGCLACEMGLQIAEAVTALV